MGTWWTWLYRLFIQLLQWLMDGHPWSRRRASLAIAATDSSPRRHPMQPNPKWVRQEVIRSKALMPQADCRTIAHHYNQRWQHQRQMTMSKTHVADTCRKHQYQILHARRTRKHRVPRPIPRNRIWGCDLLVKADRHGQPHLALAILDHASRACVRLQRLSDKSSLTLFREVLEGGGVAGDSDLVQPRPTA